MIPSEQEITQAETLMSEHQKKLSEMREKMFSGLEKMGKEGVITKKAYQYIDSNGKEYFFQKEGLRDKDGNTPPMGQYKELRHKMEGFVNGHRLEADFAEYPTHAAALVEREVTSREQHSVKLDGIEIPKDDAEKFIDTYGQIAYDIDKEREILEKADEEAASSKIQDILF